MIEFTTELTRRIHQTRENLRRAEEADEPYLVEVTQGELESLTRLAVDHGVEIGVEIGPEPPRSPDLR